MLPALKSEFRKLLSVRSTYVITAFSVLLTLFIAGFGMAYKENPQSFSNPGFLANNIASMLSLITIFCGIVAMLQFSHEYRYNTVMYTLTSVNGRSKVLFAKIITLSLYAVVFTALMAVLTVIANYIGVALAGETMAPQHIQYADLAWKGLFTGWGYAMLGLMLVGLARNQVFAIVAYFLIPTMVESLLGILLKDNVVYLPFSAMNAVLGHVEQLSSTGGALTFMAWLVGGWVVTWGLFLRRDAN